MSVFWSTERIGYDGDYLRGDVKVNYWQPVEDFEAELDAQLAQIRAEMLAERPRLIEGPEAGL
jgi:hypothetical protein